MKIFHVITTLGSGGAEAMLCKLLRQFQQEKVQSYVICLGDRGHYGDEVERAGAELHLLNIRSMANYPLALWRLRRLIVNIRPDVIQGWMPHGNLAATLAQAMAPTAPVLLWNIRQTIYNLNTEKRQTRMIINILAKMSGRPDKVLYNSQLGLTQHEAIGYRTSRSMLVPNGFDCRRFSPDPNAREKLRQRLGVSADTILIGLVGRADPMKNQEGFLRSFQRLAASQPVHAVLVGRGVDPANAALTACCAQLELEGKVTLLGEQSDMAAISAGFDIACSASLFGEGFSNAVGEAMACGVPCVVTDIGESAQIVGDAGLVVAPDNEDLLTNALQIMLDMAPEERFTLGKRARERILQNYSIQSVAQHYLNLYRGLVHE